MSVAAEICHQRSAMEASRSYSALARRSRSRSRSASSVVLTASAPSRRTGSGASDSSRSSFIMLAKLASSGTPPSTVTSRPASLMLTSAGTACAATRSLSISMRTRSRDSVSSPARAAMQADRPAASGRSAVAIGGVEAEEAQDAQIILGDPPRRVADEAHAPLLEIVEPADMIVDRAVARRIERVHGEVAPLGIAPPVAPERDPGMAPVGLDILAQRRHLERRAVDHDRDGAVVDAGRHRLEARGRGAAHHLLRHGGGGEVDVADRLAEQRVAHGAADHARFLAVAVEHVEQPRQRSLAQPGARSGPIWMRRGELMRQLDFNLVCPGTNLPSSICAGI